MRLLDTVGITATASATIITEGILTILETVPLSRPYCAVADAVDSPVYLRRFTIIRLSTKNPAGIIIPPSNIGTESETIFFAQLSRQGESPAVFPFNSGIQAERNTAPPISDRVTPSAAPATAAASPNLKKYLLSISPITSFKSCSAICTKAEGRISIKP